jgi:hypothetical protein
MKLPTFLVKSIANAFEFFTNVTCTVHGDDQKARITIMFEQNDNKQTVCKSKSTVSRDHRRMEKYNSKTDNINQCVDISTTMIQNERVQLLNKVDDIDNELCDMDIAKHVLQSENSDKMEVKINNITSNNEELAESLTNNYVDETINNTNETIDVSENKTETKTVNQIIEVIKERNEDQTSVNSKMVMSKVVLKHSKNSPDILIGKVTGSNKLLLRIFFKNRPIRKKNCLWRPCLLMDQDEMSNLYRGHSIDASYQVSVHLA